MCCSPGAIALATHGVHLRNLRARLPDVRRLLETRTIPSRSGSMMKCARPGVVCHQRVVQTPTLISLIAQIPQRDSVNIPTPWDPRNSVMNPKTPNGIYMYDS